MAGLVRVVLVAFAIGFTGVLALAYLALNGYLGQQAQKTAEDEVLRRMGESRGSYFLKHMTPLKDQPLHKQTDALVDAGQATYQQGSDASSGATKAAGDAGQGTYNTAVDTAGAVGQGVTNAGTGLKQGLTGEKGVL